MAVIRKILRIWMQRRKKKTHTGRQIIKNHIQIQIALTWTFLNVNIIKVIKNHLKLLLYVNLIIINGHWIHLTFCTKKKIFHILSSDMSARLRKVTAMNLRDTECWLKLKIWHESVHEMRRHNNRKMYNLLVYN